MKIKSFINPWKSLDTRQWIAHWPSVLSAAIAFAIALFLIWTKKSDDDLVRIGAVSCLGISLFLFVTLLFEKPADRSRRALGALLGVLILVGLGWAQRGWTTEYFMYHYAYAFLISHLAVSVVPFLSIQRAKPFGTQQALAFDQSFWGANWFLLTRAEMAGAQTFLLSLGCNAALASLHFLFDVKVDGEYYATTWALFAILGSALLFIGSLGEKISAPLTPPDILTRVVRTVFTPLALLYLTILYAYAVKIILARDWPRGGIGWLVSGLALIVSFSYVIMRPLESSDEFGAKLKTFWRWSFRLLIPPLILLALAISRRVQEYGWTQDRVILALLNAWMIGVCIYYWTPSRRSLAGIPLSLFAVALVTWLGPLSPTAIGSRSQSARLQALLAIERSLLTWENKKSVNDILRYLCNIDGAQEMARAAGVTIELSDEASKPSNGCTGYYQQGDVTSANAQVLQKLGIESVSPYAAKGQVETTFTYGRSHSNSPIAFKSLMFTLIEFQSWAAPNQGTSNWRVNGEAPARFRFDKSAGRLEWNPLNGDEGWRPVDLMPLIAAIKERKNQKTMSQKLLSDRLGLEHIIEVSSDGWIAEIQVLKAEFPTQELTKINGLELAVALRKISN